MAKPRFKVGDMVYSWQNPNVKRRVSFVRVADPNDPMDQHQYVVSLRDKDDYSYSSKWMGEKSMRKTKKRSRK